MESKSEYVVTYYHPDGKGYGATRHSKRSEAEEYMAVAMKTCNHVKLEIVTTRTVRQTLVETGVES